MAFTSINRSIGAGIGSFTLTIPVEKGRLKSVAVHQISGTGVPGANHVRCSVSGGGEGLQSSLVKLFSGTFTTSTPLGWDGDIPLSATMSVSATINFSAPAEIKLSLITDERK